MSFQAVEESSFSLREIDLGCTIVTLSFATLGIIAIASLQSFEYLLWVPLIAPLHFLRSSESLQYGLDWFSAGIPGKAGRTIERFTDRTTFAIYAGFGFYYLSSVTLAYVATKFLPAEGGLTLWSLPYAALWGGVQIVVASALVGTLSIVCTGLGAGGTDPAGGIDVAVDGSRSGALGVVTVSIVTSLAYLMSQSGWFAVAGYALGLACVSLVGAFAARGVIATVRSNYESRPDHDSGASRLYAAIKDLTGRRAQWKVVAGGILYVPGLPLGFFLAAFVIRLVSSLLHLFWSCVRDLPDNMAHFYFATPVIRPPELIPNVPIDHDIRMANVWAVAKGAWAKGKLSNRIFALFWAGMLGVWWLGGYSYRLYLKSSFFFMIPLLPIYEDKISINPVGIRNDWRRISAIYSLVSGILLIILFIGPLFIEFYSNSASSSPTPAPLLFFSFGWYRYDNVMSYIATFGAGFSLLYLRTRQHVIDQLEDQDVKYVVIAEAKRSENQDLATTVRDHQIASSIRWIFSKMFWALNFAYLLLYLLHLHGYLEITNEWQKSVLKGFYGANSYVMFAPVSEIADE